LFFFTRVPGTPECPEVNKSREFAHGKGSSSVKSYLLLYCLADRGVG
jgi:hypothetical protein